MTEVPKIHKKRGRKSKQELMDIINGTTPALVVAEISGETETISKQEKKELNADSQDPAVKTRRGRKPNSVKILQNVNSVDIHNAFSSNHCNLPSIILHLKCRLTDTLESNDYVFCDISNNNTHNLSTATVIKMDDINDEKGNEILTDYSNILKQNLNPDVIHRCTTGHTSKNAVQDKNKMVDETEQNDRFKNQTKELNKKIKHLDFILNLNIKMKSSACFWCTEPFSNPPIFIPKHKCEDTFHVYGNFCSLECAAAHLMKSSEHQSIIMEQYSLLHSLYLECQPNSTKYIKLAPEPRYMLDKFLGNLSIEEYRMLHDTNRFFILLDKPISKITPEYHEEYSNFRIQEKNIPSAYS
tara:strand:+ start:1516 stop:2583 length:1068 start_codon:yes stop_codon:yes gene_type:complete